MTAWSELQTIQPIATKMLQNSILKKRIAHAYLFHGPSGTGKRQASLLFAMRYFCEDNSEGAAPCLNCSQCKRIQSGNHPDVHFIEPDGQSIKKEQITFLQKEFTYSGLESTQKVYIILEAEKMTVNAANRLLKFLEEPSRETVAILITNQIGRMLDTIISRCQRITFHPLTTEDVTQQLSKEGLALSTAKMLAAMNISHEEAIRLNGDDWFADARKIMVQLIDKVMNPNEEGYIFLHQTWLKHFKDRQQIEFGLDLLLLWYQDIISFHLDQEEAIVLIDQLERLEKYCSVVSLSEAKAIVYEILHAKRKLTQNVHSTLTMEYLVLMLQR
ncbi:DNA polymerase III subunit delta' [Bacillaceae bacterium W0354]